MSNITLLPYDLAEFVFNDQFNPAKTHISGDFGWMQLYYCFFIEKKNLHNV